MPILEDLAAYRVLAIDDEEANLDLLQFFLADEGVRDFTGISDVRKALAALNEVQPDLVLLDLHMPHSTASRCCARCARRWAGRLSSPCLC